jgi:hypothetical protein
LLDTDQRDSVIRPVLLLRTEKSTSEKVRRRHEQIPSPSPKQGSRPIEWYREVVSALGFQLRPELLALDRPLNQRTPDEADSQLERTAFVPPAWRASLYPHRLSLDRKNQAGYPSMFCSLDIQVRLLIDLCDCEIQCSLAEIGVL